LILSLVSWQDYSFTKSFAYALNECIDCLFIVDFNIDSAVKLHSAVQGVFGCKIDNIALAHATGAKHMQDTVVFADILNDVFDDKISSDEHIGVQHLFELIVAVHISLNLKHAFLSIIEQAVIQIVIVDLLDTLLIDIRSLSYFIIITWIIRCRISFIVGLSFLGLFILDFSLLPLLLKVPLDDHELLSFIMRDLGTAATYLNCLLHSAIVQNLPIEDVKFKGLHFRI
jgi:hypothetical protein